MYVYIYIYIYVDICQWEKEWCNLYMMGDKNHEFTGIGWEYEMGYV